MKADPMAVYRGYSSHYGAGLGNVLSGLLRQAVPLVAPALRDVGRSLVSAGARKLHNIIDDKLGGAGQPRPKRRRRPVKKAAAVTRRSVQSKGRSKADIFGTR
jgi:hypothetical protein